MPDGKRLRDDQFVVGVFGRNQLRKRIDLSISYFAEWIKRSAIENAILMLHVAPTGENGVDIDRLVAYHELQGRVMVFRPRVGVGAPDVVLRHIYGACDVYLSTSQAEGWNLHALEAMACGIPCIVPSWAGLGDLGWAGDAALRVKCSELAPTAPLGAPAYTLGGVPDCSSTVQALGTLAQNDNIRKQLSERGLALAAQLTWQHTGAALLEQLEAIVSQCEEERQQAAAAVA